MRGESRKIKLMISDICFPATLSNVGLVWDSHNGNVERFIEMYSMWCANDFSESEYFPKELVNNKSLTVNEILNTDALLGFTGGGDCHERLCGMPV